MHPESELQQIEKKLKSFLPGKTDRKKERYRLYFYFQRLFVRLKQMSHFLNLPQTFFQKEKLEFFKIFGVKLLSSRMIKLQLHFQQKMT